MIIYNGTVVTGDGRVLPNHAVEIEERQIKAVAPTHALTENHPETHEWIDAQGQLIMPGSICAHTHFYGAYARGMNIPGEPPADFPAILSRLWWNLDKALNPDAVRLSALVSLVDAIKHGTTTLIDHHASPNAIDGSLDLIADAVERAGLRAVLCYEVTDRDGREKAEAGIAENVRFLQENWRENVRGTFGLHASLSLSDETLRACVDAHPKGEQGGFHIHVAEHEADEDDAVARYGKRVVHRLYDLGILNRKSIAAHCVHIDEAEQALLAATGTWITHQPRSNMNNAVGAMRFDAMMRDGLPVCLGNDGFSNAMWEEWKAAYFLHKIVHRDPRLANGGDIARVALENNARLVETFFEGERVGVLAEGAQADIILVDYHPFTPLTEGNLPWHVIFGLESSMVTTTICAGKVLMRDRHLMTLDERAIAAEALAHAPKVWEQYRRFAETI